jgi:hypothetical protein
LRILLQAAKYKEDDATDDSEQTADPLAAQLLVALVRAKTVGTGRRCAKTQASFTAALATVAHFDDAADQCDAAAGSDSVSNTVKQQLVVAAVCTRLQQCLSERYLTLDDMMQAFPATAVSTQQFLR